MDDIQLRADGFRRSDAFYRALIDHGHDVVTVFGTDGTILFQSPSVRRVLGHGPGERVGHNFVEMVHADDRAGIDDALDNAIAQPGVPIGCEARVARTDGGWRILRLRMTFVATGDPEPFVIANGQDITELVAARDAWRDSEVRLADAQRIAHFGSWQWNAQTGVFVGSNEVYRICGIQPVDGIVTLEACLARIHCDDRAAFHDAVKRTLRHKAPFNVAHRYVRPGGEIIHLHEDGEALCDADGRVIGITGTVQDVTARKRAEEELLRKEHLLSEAQSIAGIGSWETDTRTNTIFWSDELYRLLGYEPGSLHITPEAYMSRVHADDRARLAQVVRELEETGEPIQMEYRLVVDGQLRHVHVRAHASRDASGKVRRTYGTVQDVTARKHAEQALLTSERRLEEAQRFARIGNWEADLVNEDYYWSKELFRLFGADVDDAAPDIDVIQQRVHPDDRPIVCGLVQKLLCEGRSASAEYRIMVGGDTRWVMARGEAERDADGKPVRAYGTIQDITDQRRAEAQLLQAQKMETVGQLSGGLAHDFNNLLLVIQGNLELIRERFQDRPDVVQIDAALRAADRGSDLTQRLLAFSRKQALTPKLTRLDRLVVGMTQIVGRTLGGNIEIEVAMTPGLWPCLVDPAQLESALLNLAVNARDAMPDGGTVTIGLRNVSVAHDTGMDDTAIRPGDYVEIAVSDTGVGMTAEVKARVFEPFFTTKDHGKGSGLGLSMVFGFVKQSGGHVTIASKAGQGTIVTLYLPRGPAGAPAQADPSAGPVSRLRPDKVVLIVEDDADVRSFVVLALTSLGYATLQAPDGPTALRLVEEGAEFDLLFTDLVLPGGMNGREVAEAVRARRPDVAVVYTSGYAPDVLAGRLGVHSDVDILTKPYRRKTLAERIAKALGVD